MRADREYTFETFMCHQGNQEAYEEMRLLGGKKDKDTELAGQLLWLQGTSGTGKTHLLYALQHDLKQREGKKARQISCRDLLKEIITMWEWDVYEDTVEDYIARFCREDVIMIEDVDYCLQGKDASRYEISRLIGKLINHHGKQVVITSHELLEPFYSMTKPLVRNMKVVILHKK